MGTDIPAYTREELSELLDLFHSNEVVGAMRRILEKAIVEDDIGVLLKEVENPPDGKFTKLGVLYNSYNVICKPLILMPLYINSDYRSVRTIAAWRMKKGI